MVVLSCGTKGEVLIGVLSEKLYSTHTPYSAYIIMALCPTHVRTAL